MSSDLGYLDWLFFGDFMRVTATVVCIGALVVGLILMARGRELARREVVLDGQATVLSIYERSGRVFASARRKFGKGPRAVITLNSTRERGRQSGDALITVRDDSEAAVFRYGAAEVMLDLRSLIFRPAVRTGTSEQ